MLRESLEMIIQHVVAVPDGHKPTFHIEQSAAYFMLTFKFFVANFLCSIKANKNSII